MPFNQFKKYPQLLELGHLPEHVRIKSLKGVFERDIENNPNLKFRKKTIRPIKGEEPSMQLLFRHLTTEEIDEETEQGKSYKRRVFEMNRSQRLHWVKFHIDESLSDGVEFFSKEERVKGKTVFRTYIYDKKQKYVVVLEPQRSGTDYYLLSAYHLNRSYGEKMMKKKLRSKHHELL
jgi:hypothetical protein